MRNWARPAPGEKRVVFMGDSITDAWGHPAGVFFPGKPYVNRGISGQTTPQMLVRFWPDVIALQPKVVVILAGTNDIAGNTGPTTPTSIEDNLMAMADLARANGIRVVMASILPAAAYPWKPGIDPRAEISADQQLDARLLREETLRLSRLLFGHGRFRPGHEERVDH